MSVGHAARWVLLASAATFRGLLDARVAALLAVLVAASCSTGSPTDDGPGSDPDPNPGDDPPAGPVVPTDQLEDHYFTMSDGIRIHFLTMGAEGSWVVLVHGYTSSAQANWVGTGIVEALAEDHRVVALDTRNHGESDTPFPGGPGSSRDVLELLEHLEVDRVHLHGYSMGGRITGTIVRSDPELLITASFGGSGLYPLDDGLDVTSVAIPMLAINGENDDPEERTAGMEGLPDYTEVVIPNAGHLTAPYFSQYIQSLSTFLLANDG